MTELFSPSTFLYKELEESANTCLTRIEISYYAEDTKAEQEYFEPEFARQSRLDIAWVKIHINEHH